ncbi:hypothetical protein A0256_19735 [Mucilaginibacter sp. PAMC 26640]|nr:hypothetical protein A0256_19735 [Mucilaginibacter sp. PAMC 26640]
MIEHRGNTVEYVIRKNGYSISTLAAGMGVNRRSVYNWFNNKLLKSVIIYKIGCLINHDFSKEFPDLFKGADFNNPENKFKPSKYLVDAKNSNTDEWKMKYIYLLEKYNQLLFNDLESSVNTSKK